MEQLKLSLSLLQLNFSQSMAEKSITIPKKENKNIEFKEKLSPETHLKNDKKQHLASQMKFRLETGDGRAVYILGVDDKGNAKGLTELEFEESLNVLRVIARENSAEIEKVEKFEENGKTIGRILISRKYETKMKQHIIVATAGHVRHGKSTLIATLMTGEADRSHKAWLYLNVLPHEIERGLSADLHYGLYGFRAGEILHLKNPLNKKERAKIVEKADKLVSFIDAPGHEPFLRTTIRGLVGQSLDYSLLIVAADDGITNITKEHLGILLGVNLPVIVCITKTDRVGEKRISEVEQQIEELLKNVGRVPFPVRYEKDIGLVIDKLDMIVPVIRTSAVNLEGYDLLNKLLYSLPERKKELEKPFLMFIDRIYNVSGAGTVVSGTIKQGKLKAGSELLLGPDASGNFKKVKAKSIEMHYHPLEEADAGLVVGIAIRGMKHEEVKRGMVLCDESVKPRAVKSFEAEILVLNHPTRIATNYEPVVHCQTTAEVARIECLDKEYLKAGDSGLVRFTFKYNPHFLEVGDRFVFREGKTKGIGTITKIVKYAG
ncbi:MAG: GTP-binding protein [Candidatus Aenigmarchaeota archaeon]|nr:GTP-binding protein [Candidatus Aenigmarchaeota archaeon]